VSACPICRKPAQPRASNPAAPFCSPRCKQIDLGKWLDEAYTLPAEEPGESEDSRERAPHDDKEID
jgi:uncharacterized protein